MDCIMKWITLSQITGEDDTGEDDGRAETFLPYQIFNPATNIRSMTPRKYGRVGTRISFVHGGAVAVRETLDEVNAALQSLNN